MIELLKDKHVTMHAFWKLKKLNLEREFKIAEQALQDDHLDLVLATGYLAKLPREQRVLRYTGQVRRVPAQGHGTRRMATT